jgi:hypothetical protein
MNVKALIVLVFLALPQLATAADSQWVLEQSTPLVSRLSPATPD